MSTRRNQTTAPERRALGGDLLREDLVRAATRIFSRRGFHGTSMQHIADEAGMRKASLYHHVRGKEDFLYAIHEDLIRRLLRGTMEVISTSRSPGEKLHDIICVNTQIVVDDIDAVNVFLKEREAVSGERWQAIVAKRDLYEEMVQGVLREGIRSGEFEDGDPEVLAKAILAMPAWISTWYRPDGRLTALELADVFANVALRGVSRRVQ